MRFVTTRKAANLIGLSTERLREWSSRRALIPADVQNRGRGSPAQYGWQAILLLRIASLLKDRYHLELHAYRALFAGMRETLSGSSFLKLWGRSLAIYDSKTWELLDASAASTASADAIIIRLDPHLSVLAAEFAMPSPAPAGQLELFPARLVSGERANSNDTSAVELEQQQMRRRA